MQFSLNRLILWIHVVSQTYKILTLFVFLNYIVDFKINNERHCEKHEEIYLTQHALSTLLWVLASFSSYLYFSGSQLCSHQPTVAAGGCFQQENSTCQAKNRQSATSWKSKWNLALKESNWEFMETKRIELALIRKTTPNKYYNIIIWGNIVISSFSAEYWIHSVPIQNTEFILYDSLFINSWHLHDIAFHS